MDLDAIHEIMEDLQTYGQKINDGLIKSVLINIDWMKEYVDVKNGHDISCESRLFSIQHDFYEKGKEEFINELLENIVRFALLNIEIEICICDLGLPKDKQIIYETKSCKTFCEKVCDFTKLERLRIFPVLLPKYKAELYFYVLPDVRRIQRLLIANNSFNTAAVNTLVIQMISKCDDNVCDDISFIGKVGSEAHGILKRLVDEVIQMLSAHLKKRKDEDEDDKKTNNNKVVDLTEIEDKQSIGDETFYDFNTSDIMEVDGPLDSYYNKEFKSLTDGWDIQVDMEKYTKVICACDEEIFERFFNDCMDYADKKVASNEVVILDDEPQMISIDDSQRRKAIFDVKSFRENRSKKYDESQSLRASSSSTITQNLPAVPKRVTRRDVTKTIKSNLFDDEEVKKWKKAENPDMKTILSTNSKDYKAFDSSNYRIPKKTSSSPHSRRPIHETKVDRQRLSEQNIHIFDRRLGNLLPYNSPSNHRNTPDSVSKFINPDKNVVIIDDDDNNNNSSQNDQNSTTGIRKRKLFNVSPKQPMIFKNRKQDVSNLKESPFAASSSRNSSFRR